MNCENVRKLLNEYIENNLTDAVSQSLSEHLQECERCAMEEGILRTLLTTLRSLPQKLAPADFTDHVMEELSKLDDVPATVSTEKAGLISRLASKSGLQPAWIGMRMTARSVGFIKYVPRPTVRLRIGEDRNRSLTKLPLALGFRW